MYCIYFVYPYVIMYICVYSDSYTWLYNVKKWWRSDWNFCPQIVYIQQQQNKHTQCIWGGLYIYCIIMYNQLHPYITKIMYANCSIFWVFKVKLKFSLAKINFASEFRVTFVCFEIQLWKKKRRSTKKFLQLVILIDLANFIGNFFHWEPLKQSVTKSVNQIIFLFFTMVTVKSKPIYQTCIVDINIFLIQFIATP